ncbi:ACT domain-containing protein [Pseudoduganella sp. RAF53_2]|uniref:ACT domain-containing protein n=1 Tax=unclassified Pseudoduganella TaxID=2637179 RepID=UPI003F9EA3C3
MHAASSLTPKMNLSLGKSTLAVARLAVDADIPQWALGKMEFCSISRTQDELSIVCDENAVPAGMKAEMGWRALKIDGPLDFGLTGILASVATPLAKAGISIFVVSTFDTDYVLVKQDRVAAAAVALRGAGHTVRT